MIEVRAAARRARWAIAGCALLAACGPDRYQTSLRRVDLGTEPARLTGILATESGGHGEWIYAGDWHDELVLTRVDGSWCVALTLRDPVATTLDDLEFVMLIDGQPVGITVEPGAATALAPVDEPDRLTTDGALISGRVCTDDRPARRIDLQLVHLRLVWRRNAGAEPHRYQARYRWTIRD